MVAPPPPPFSMEVLRVMLGLFCNARRVFPDECFELARRHSGADRTLVLKKPPLADRGAERLYNMVEFGVAECLDRQCVRSISFLVVDASNDQVVEEMTMECGHARGDYPLRTPGDALRELTKKHQLLVQTLSPIPRETTFALRLTLIGAKMPYLSWVPPFFHSAAAEVVSKKQLNDESLLLRLGQFDSAPHLCSMSIRSTQDPIRKLAQSDISSNCHPDVAFDPEFTLPPAATSEVEPAELKDVSLYQAIKKFVLSSSAPSMRSTHDTFQTVKMPAVRAYFSQLCQEGLLERRGRRFYGVKRVTCVSDDEQIHDRSSSPRRRKRVPAPQVVPQDSTVVNRSQSHRQCWVPKSPIVSMHPRPLRSDARTGCQDADAGSGGTDSHRKSHRSLLVASTPVIQSSTRHQLRYHPKHGRPVLVTSTPVIQYRE